MTELDYTEPVSQLLALGDEFDQSEWRDYSALGITHRPYPGLDPVGAG